MKWWKASSISDDFLDSQEMKHVYGDETIRTIELYFKDGKPALSYASWPTLRKEICGFGAAHGKQVVEQKNPCVISP